MRVLFFNEGNLGAHTLGHAQLDDALRSGLESASDVEARFASLAPMSRPAEMTASHPLKPFAKAGLDFQTLRWHLVQSMRARAELNRQLAEWPADVVHVYSHAIAFAMVATMRRVPMVLATDTTVWDWWAMPAWRPTQRYAPVTIPPSRALERRALQKAALVLARTAWTRRTIERDAPRAHTREYHPGIDLARYRPAVRRPRARPTVLFVGGRFAEKGGNDLLAVLGEQIGREVDVDIVTLADVPDRPGVRVHRLMPSDPRLLDLQQQADIMCLPTHGDTNPWAVLESMACATPVVSTRIGGIPDMLDEGRAGVIVRHGDRNALGDALRALLQSPERRTELAGRARERCEQHYDSQRQFPILIEHLREAAAGGPRGLQTHPASADDRASMASGPHPRASSHAR
jgi:glycosyltransferase involved in cell wall biosynthesis